MHDTTRILAPDAGPVYAVAGDSYRILARGEDTNGAFALFDALIPPGGGPPPHTHSREDESFYVVQGAIAFQLGDQRQIARAGAYVYAPRGRRHAFRNESDAPARMLVQVTPAGFERFFEQAGRRLEGGAQPAPPTIEELERLIALAPTFGCEIHTASGQPS